MGLTLWWLPRELLWHYVTLKNLNLDINNVEFIPKERTIEDF